MFCTGGRDVVRDGEGLGGLPGHWQPKDLSRSKAPSGLWSAAAAAAAAGCVLGGAACVYLCAAGWPAACIPLLGTLGRLVGR